MILGWLYQYYINDPKDALINAKKQYKSKDIPFVTQIFTSDWIVRFMVQNSIGRFWEEHSDKDIKEYDWEYYLDSGVPTSKNTIDPKDIRIIDPCMGSGHILVYVFDVLLQIYESYGYTSKEAVEYILQDNIYGFDISERAYQLSYFSVMMKARKYNRTILKKGIKPHLYVLNKKEKMSNELISFISRENNAISRELTVINSEIENIDVRKDCSKGSDQEDYLNFPEYISDLEKWGVDIAPFFESEEYYSKASMYFIKEVAGGSLTKDCVWPLAKMPDNIAMEPEKYFKECIIPVAVALDKEHDSNNLDLYTALGKH